MDIKSLIEQYKMNIHGIIHIGAHHMEERVQYLSIDGINDDNIIWIEADRNLVNLCRKHYPPMIRILEAAIAEVDGRECNFGISSNTGASSSILPLGTHAVEYPTITFERTEKLKTSRLDTLLRTNGIPLNIANFINIDIQGAELLAFNGMGDVLNNVDYILSEVNVNELYVGCGLIDQVDSYLAKLGFTRVFTHFELQGWGDALYIKR